MTLPAARRRPPDRRSAGRQGWSDAPDPGAERTDGVDPPTSAPPPPTRQRPSDGPIDPARPVLDAPAALLPRRQRPEHRPGFRSPLIILPLILAAALYGLYLWAAADADEFERPVSAAFLVPASIIAAWVALRRVGQHETRFDLRTIVLTGFVARLLGCYLRYTDPVDAGVYHREGIRIAAELRRFDLWPETGREIPGTGWLRYVSGVVHVLAFDDMFASFLGFTTLAFAGSYFAYRAFVMAMPTGNHRKYALLVFLWPSLLYWPSSIGKEAWMMFGIGIACWGVAAFFADRARVALPVLGLGMVTISLLRPHVALIILVGFSVALLARRTETRSTSRLVVKVLSVGLILVGGSIIAAYAADVLKVDNTGTESVTQALDNAAEQTSQGTGMFSATTVHSPVEYPWAFVTVWFRPLPWEARSNVSQMLSAAENMLLIGLVALSWRRLRYLPRALLRLPYATFAVSYCLAFVFAFSAIGNFGILARQRTQGLFLFFVILCLPDLAARGSAATHRSRRAARGAPGEEGRVATDRSIRTEGPTADDDPVDVAAGRAPLDDRFPTRRRRSANSP